MGRNKKGAISILFECELEYGQLKATTRSDCTVTAVAVRLLKWGMTFEMLLDTIY
jgi:hypothetical protein